MTNPEPQGTPADPARCPVCGREVVTWNGEDSGYCPVSGGCWREVEDGSDGECYRLGYERLLAERQPLGADPPAGATAVYFRIEASGLDRLLAGRGRVRAEAFEEAAQLAMKWCVCVNHAMGNDCDGRQIFDAIRALAGAHPRPEGERSQKLSEEIVSAASPKDEGGENG